ncbi:ABC transporter ATP-binding protein [Salinirussus salinus]|jgi:putative ABC transport system ATP-binding protein|uniref:ABC transporter ATP-binding protein n=1 Tax=Salinirussus salinus TaxID=1198300 RepID=UPI001359E17E|nr:ABC transporter ATP-binding protein [Salinirussus salinus]
MVVSTVDAVKEYESGDRTLRALKGVSLSIDPGEFVSVVGPSGSGKSTLLNLLGLLDEPTEGTVTVAGTEVSALSTRERTDIRRETVGFVFQDFYLLPTLTARENVAVPGMVSDRSRLLERADDLLARVGLDDRLTHYPDELSGGQKQRVAIARSMVNDPDVLLADEPTGNLDRETGSRVLDVFGQFTDEGVAVVTVTHDAQVSDYADRTVELVDGVLTPEGRI